MMIMVSILDRFLRFYISCFNEISQAVRVMFAPNGFFLKIFKIAFLRVSDAVLNINSLPLKPYCPLNRPTSSAFLIWKIGTDKYKNLKQNPT